MHPMVGVAQTERARIISSFTNSEGQPCRVVEQSVFISGRRVRATGTMCEQPNGVWTLSR
jgi:surface antigen